MSRVMGVALLVGLVVIAVGHRNSNPLSETLADPSPAASAPPGVAQASRPDQPTTPPLVALVALGDKVEPILPLSPAAAAPIVLSASTMIVRQAATLRREPYRKATTAGLVRPDDVVIERDRRGSWREVEGSDGRRGWLQASAFDAPKAAAAPRLAPETGARPIKPLPTVEPRSAKPALAVAAIAALIVQESRSSYGGSCGCPDDRDRGGRRCGGRSAYSRAGGRSIFCYPADVTEEMVAQRGAR